MQNSHLDCIAMYFIPFALITLQKVAGPCICSGLTLYLLCADDISVRSSPHSGSEANGRSALALGADNYTIDHVVPGETVEQVLGRAQHLVC